jgi:uncharacterized protein (TIGR02996 family)
MTAAEAGLLEDILDHPDDDVPRLIYADWLTDRGRPDDEARARLIRVQCQLAGLKEGDPARRWLDLRATQVLHLFESRWLPEDWRSPSLGAWERGFFRVQSRLWPFRIRAEEWFRYPAVLEAQVSIRGAGDGGLLAIDEEHVCFLATTPLLARVTELSVRGRPHPDLPRRGDDIARAVAGSTHARRLRRLELSCLSDVGARAMVESPNLTALEVVSLYAHVALSDGMRERLVKRFRAVRG